MVIANSIKTSTPNYVIADIALSDFGRKEIKIAETEMPGLMALREKHKSDKPPSLTFEYLCHLRIQLFFKFKKINH